MRPLLRPPWPIQTQLLRWHLQAPQSIPRRIATTSATNAAPVDIPKLILAPGSTRHNSLETFLEYAKRQGLTNKSSVYVGTHYEYTCALSLMRLGFSLLRVGKKSDDGIDLIGHWVLAPLREPLRVIIQCKARNMSVSPCHVRELEGSFQGTPANWKNKDVLGLIITSMKATKGVLKALGDSRWPMGFVMITKTGLIQQFLASSKAAKFRNTGTRKDIQLTWMGSPIFPDRNSFDQDTLKLLKSIAPSMAIPDVPPVFWNGALRAGHQPPIPRGGMIKGKRGRPKGGSNGIQLTMKPLASTNRGRPTIAASKVKRSAEPDPGRRPRGRPKGSKNKPKLDADAG
ncbi:hypothetical protein DE146DRAFT_726703 [Phaeosphaeria sp. MPI-PUGE-AT-0046c]|nr:hypothetical protein DE146DRAFT_731166 [Phaeosphaeria sp. MPI-PUGE-AT-0046c]KAH7385364.1 hypothetical protein DE146DRAFT_726703 [Phaeosphaeria sp. MPI-PUGE-AT-0046c]